MLLLVHLLLLFVTTCDDNQLCLFHNANRSQWLVIHHILEIFCVLFYCALACLHSYQTGVWFERDSSSGFTIKETFVVMFWEYADLRRVCPQVFKVSSYFANKL